MFFGGSDEDDGSGFSVGMPTQQRSGYENNYLFFYNFILIYYLQNSGQLSVCFSVDAHH